ncbi:hypothetical protein BU24DRAFT_457712 [Aaosphaeria arxii CBS 175.79]|uniref:Uncharacterized protein n=1 Tax=Aaosphaeria arxii CBS 175.79 TaxID=1450172 RepID=A0A6A5YB03_9PLEO|nr:uncharacterized protein BU24DRAFT_457712 [Aaosphaeria arxii CBS 175.79]KAF2021774.1 hypothetical protein BU24DRAFT_457712 [Aaosphaeria arxii CBS 175.79]
MSTSQADLTQYPRVTPPQSIADQPLTPPKTDKKAIAGALRIEFRLVEGEYGLIEKTLQQDNVLSGYVQDKIRSVNFRYYEWLLVWIFPTARSRAKQRCRYGGPKYSMSLSGPELQAVGVVLDEAFRDDEGNAVDHPGICLRLSDFTCERLARGEMGDEDEDVGISESKLRRALRTEPLGNHAKKQERSETPPEEVTPGDEAGHAKEEERASKRADLDWIIRTEHQLRASQTRLLSMEKLLYSNARANCNYAFCPDCISRRRDALCISSCSVVPLPSIAFPVSSLNP